MGLARVASIDASTSNFYPFDVNFLEPVFNRSVDDVRGFSGRTSDAWRRSPLPTA
jgi:hypothetical protein